MRDYPKSKTRIEGHFEPWLPALVNADAVDHLQITGQGTLDGSGEVFWDAFWNRRKENPKCTNLEVERPRLVFIQNSKDVLISGITFKDSGFWNLHLYHCHDVIVEKLDIHAAVGLNKRAPSTDGMDIDSCQNVSVRNCTFAVHDDCIALKGSKGPFAMDDKDSPPVEHIRISGCTFKNGGAAVTCGSEATIVRDVVLEKCTVTGDMPLVHLKLRPDTPQLYEDIHVSEVVLQAGVIFDVSPWTQFFDLKGQPPPTSLVRNVSVSDIKGAFASLGSIQGNKNTTIQDITLKNIDAKVKSEAFEHTNIENLNITNVVLNGTPLAGK